MPKKRPKPSNDLDRYVSITVADPFYTKPLAAVDKTYHPHPMPRKWWSNRCAMDMEIDTVVHAAVDGQTKIVLGYIVSSWDGNSRAVTIERLLVSPQFRRSKVATQLLLRVKADMPPITDRLIYVVPELDLDTQLFLKETGFKARLPLKANAFPGYVNENGILFVRRNDS
jgi:hypothetical protein